MPEESRSPGRPAKVAAWGQLKDRKPVHALVANVDLAKRTRRRMRGKNTWVSIRIRTEGLRNLSTPTSKNLLGTD